MKLNLKLIFILIFLNLLIVSSFLLYTHVYKHINNEIIYLIIIGSYALTFYVARKLKMITLRYKRPDIRQVFEWSLISLFIWLISLVEINILNPNFNYFEHHENRHTLISGLYYLISAPLIEEVFMKSIFMESLIKLKLKKVFVILLSSACFAIFHFPSILIVHLLMGLVTSFLYYRNKDVVQCILIHSIYNGILGIESQFY